MYFEKPGVTNTQQTLALARTRGDELGLNEVVIASTSGTTAFKAIDVFQGYRIVAVTYHGGFHQPFKNVMSAAVRQKLQDNGVTVISATHALSGVERSIVNKHGGFCPVLLIADTLKLFGQGTKVAVEVSIMATDAGMLSGNDIIAIGGSSTGADTALVLKPANQSSLFEMKIRETICKPSSF